MYVYVLWVKQVEVDKKNDREKPVRAEGAAGGGRREKQTRRGDTVTEWSCYVVVEKTVVPKEFYGLPTPGT